MRLSDQEFAEFKELKKLQKSGKLNNSQTARLAELESIKSDKQDAAWYKKYIALYNEAAKLAFNYRLGYTLRFLTQSAARELSQENVQKCEYYSTPGYSTSMNDPLNLAARKLWTALNKFYRGINVYEQSDVGIMLYGVYNVAEIIAWAERIAGVVGRYKAMDGNFPRTYFNAMGLNFIAWNTGEAIKNFIFDLNYEIERFNTLFAPKEVTYVMRHIAINSLFFKDSADSEKANIFFYEPINFWVWDPTLFNSGSALDSQLLDSYKSTPAGFTPDDVIGIIRLQLNALLSDQDVTKMCSDLFNVVGEDHALRIAPLDVNYKVEPVYDQMWLQQWHNLETIPYRDTVGSQINPSVIDALHPLPPCRLYVYQFNNVIQSNFYVGTLYSFGYHGSNNVPSSAGSFIPGRDILTEDGFIDTWMPDPSADVVMELSRMKCRGTHISFTDSGSTYRAIRVGTYADIVPAGRYIYKYNSDLDTVTQTGPLFTVDSTVVEGTLRCDSHFDWHPYTFTASILVADNVNDTYIVTGFPHGDIDNIAILSRGNLDKMNRAALLSLFDLEQLIDIVSKKKS